jgi:FkbM family methyltransferase
MELEFRGIKFFFNDTPTIPMIVNEIFGDNYKIFERELEFEAGDVILDIGANEGAFSIMMAKCFSVKVISLEPVPRTYFQMIRNIGLNGVDVEAYNVGVGGKSGTVPMVVGKDLSGGSSGVQQLFDPELNFKMEVNVLSLDEVFEKYHIDKVKLLKIDIEGMEYETLYNTHVLDRVENVVGEFHMNTFLKDKLYDMNELATYVGSKSNLIYYEKCRMAE